MKIEARKIIMSTEKLDNDFRAYDSGCKQTINHTVSQTRCYF